MIRICIRKFSFILALAVVPLLANAESVTFDQVYEVPGATKDQIFSTSRIWIAEHFNSAKAVIEYENKDDGVIVGNGFIPCPWSTFQCIGNWRVGFTMRIDMKEEKFRLTFSNLSQHSPKYDGPLTNTGQIEKAKPKLFAIGDDIAKAIAKPKSADNW
jgi:hypothetical protein